MIIYIVLFALRCDWIISRLNLYRFWNFKLKMNYYSDTQVKLEFHSAKRIKICINAFPNQTVSTHGFCCTLCLSQLMSHIYIVRFFEESKGMYNNVKCHKIMLSGLSSKWPKMNFKISDITVFSSCYLTW